MKIVLWLSLSPRVTFNSAMTHIKPEPNPTGLKIRIVGVGGRGCNILERLSDLEGQGVELVAIAPSRKVFDRIQVKNKIELSLLEDVQTETRLDALQGLAKTCIDEKAEEIKQAVSASNIVFLLGNITNISSVLNTIEIARIAREAGALTLYVGAYPFSFEGIEKQNTAELNKTMLEQELDGVLVLDYEKTSAKDAVATEVLTLVDKTIASWINELIELVERVGVINVDFNDFRTTVSQGGELFFGVAEGRIDQIPTLLDKLFSNTSNRGISHEKLERAIYVISGGSGVSVATTEAVGKGIASRLDPNARIIFGLVTDPAKTDMLKISLIAAPKSYRPK